MRVVLFTDTFYPKIDGVVVSITSIIERLTPQGYQFLVICPDYHTRIRRSFPTGTEILRMPSLPLPHYRDFRFVFPLVDRCMSAARRFGAEIVHIHSYANLGYVGAAVAHRLALPLLGTYHTLAAEFTRYLSPITVLGLDRMLNHLRATSTALPPPRWHPVKSLIWKETVRLFNRCNAVTAPSRLTARELRAHGLRRPLFPISNGIDLSHFPYRRVGAPGRRLVHVGRVSFEKRVDIVLLAFKRILHEIPEATLTIVGDGPALKSLRILANKLEVDRAVQFAGFIPHTQLAPFYQGHDLFLTASPMETQGVVLLESMSCGVPVIGIDRGAIPDLIRDGYNGFVVGSPHAATMAQRAVELLGSKDLLERLSKRAVATVAEHDIASTSAQLSHLYQRLLSANQQGVLQP